MRRRRDMSREIDTGSQTGKLLSQLPEPCLETRREIQADSPRLHGRRRGKKLRGHQAFLLSSALPRLSFDASQPLADPSFLFPDRPSVLWLEIGFGGGEHLAAEALAHPSTGYIGCEVFVNGIAKALALVEAGSLRNVRLYNGDARDVIESLPPAALDGVYLLFPDPWPKRRHHGRRFLSREMLARLARVMRPGAEICFATDLDGNAGWTLANVLRSPDFIWAAAGPGDWQRPWAGWRGTRYEAKALGAARRPVYLTFRREIIHNRSN
jgi:tRNA (guanine-N7-)-methyltransferase